MKLLVTGREGQLARSIAERATDHPGLDIIFTSRGEADLSSSGSVAGAIMAVRPELVVNAAAYTAVDQAEAEPALAFRINAEGAGEAAAAAREVGAAVIQLSTDYIFDGRARDPYAEDAPTEPLSVYGRSKLGGEHEIEGGWAVARTSWVCGYHGGNMVKTILRVAADNPELRFVDDQYGHPTFADDLATGLYELAARRLPGTYHVTNQGSVSWYEFARAVMEAARLLFSYLGTRRLQHATCPVLRRQHAIMSWFNESHGRNR